MEVFLARQAIFDRNRRVYGYELLFRSNANSTSFDGAAEESPSGSVLANSLLAVGLDALLNGKKAFLNFDRALLLGDLNRILPPDILVIEVLETVAPDDAVLAACRNLARQGYAIALDDFVPGPQTEPLTSVANLIKVDVQTTPQEEQRRLVEKFKPLGITMLAEKVESAEEYEWCRGAGFDLFQGYFFTRPVLIRGRQIPSARLTCLKLLAMMQAEDLDFNALQKLISADVSLAFKLMRFANSAMFARGAEVQTIAHALVLLGEPAIRHWVALATLPAMTRDRPPELILYSLIRARLCERLAQLAGVEQFELAFLMGLFSLLDALIGIPMKEALEQVSIVPEIEKAILGLSGADDRFRLVLELARSYEAGEWEQVSSKARELRIESAALTDAYAASTLWAQQSLTATSRGEGRKRIRYTAQGTLEILWEDEAGRERMLQAKLMNVSVQGLQLQVPEKIPLLTHVSCNDAKLGISGRGAVRYCHSSKGSYLIGVEFAGGTGWRGLK